MTYIFFLKLFFYSLFCGVMWRMRGGAFATLSGVNIGTQCTRVICGLMMARPLFLVVGLWVYLIAFAIFAGLAITGWEEFQGMGTETGDLLTEKPKYWMRWLPGALGFSVGTIPYDMLGMAQAGLVCMVPVALAVGFVRPWSAMLICLGAGVGFAPCYLLARLNFPTIPNFAQGQAWGEVFTGALIGTALGLATFTSAGWSFL